MSSFSVWARLNNDDNMVSGAMEPKLGLVANKAGGFVYQISDMARFKRFLILGSDANTFYATAKVRSLDLSASLHWEVV